MKINEFRRWVWRGIAEEVAFDLGWGRDRSKWSKGQRNVLAQILWKGSRDYRNPPAIKGERA